MAWLRGFLIAICAAALALFAIANRDVVVLRLDPVPLDVDAPLYLVIIVALVLGLIIGAFAAWIAGGRDRRALRKTRRDLERLSREMTDGVSNAAQTPALPPPTP